MNNSKKQYIKNTLSKMPKKEFPKMSDLKKLPSAVNASVNPNRFGKISSLSSTDAKKKSTPSPFEIVKDGAKSILKKSIDTVVGGAKNIVKPFGDSLQKEFEMQDAQNKKWAQDAEDEQNGMYKGEDLGYKVKMPKK